MKTYSTKANANRAAKNAGLENGTFNVLEIDGRFIIECTAHTAEKTELPAPPAEVIVPAELLETQTEMDLAVAEEVVTQEKAKSEIKNPVKAVWEIADKMWGQRRKDIIAACVEAGIAYNTARTQYQAYHSIKSKEGK